MIVPLRVVITLVVLLATALGAAGGWLASRGNQKRSTVAVPLEVPASIKREHEELHGELEEAAEAGGKTGEAAVEVSRLLRPHFEKEEQYALPPLAMLRAFDTGEVPANADEALVMTQRLRAEYPRMLEEHRAIVAALERLASAAEKEGKPEQVKFAEKLRRHAETEEEILYPTVVLIGEYLKLHSAK